MSYLDSTEKVRDAYYRRRGPRRSLELTRSPTKRKSDLTALELDYVKQLVYAILNTYVVLRCHAKDLDVIGKLKQVCRSNELKDIFLNKDRSGFSESPNKYYLLKNFAIMRCRPRANSKGPLQHKIDFSRLKVL
jgi:hypothetical protein